MNRTIITFLGIISLVCTCWFTYSNISLGGEIESIKTYKSAEDVPELKDFLKPDIKIYFPFGFKIVKKDGEMALQAATVDDYTNSQNKYRGSKQEADYSGSKCFITRIPGYPYIKCEKFLCDDECVIRSYNGHFYCECEQGL